MINITIVKSKQIIQTIEATGHSGYADAGADIVCSAVSTLTESLINGLIEVVKIKPIYVIDESVPHLSVTIPKNLTDEQIKLSQVLMHSTYLGLKNVANEFSKFIKIKEKQND